MLLNIIIIVVIVLSLLTNFVLVIFVYRKRNSNKAKDKLSAMLEKSEKNRVIAETEKNKAILFFDNFIDGLIILDEKNKISSINAEALNLLSLNENRLLGKSFHFLKDFQKSKLIESTLDTGLKNISKKEIEISKDFIIELSVVPINFNRNSTSHLIVIHDISKEKIADRMKTDFVSLAAHQLKTPLSTMKWSISMLKKGDFGKITKKQNEIIENIFQNNENLISIVSDLLDMPRIEEGKYLNKIKNIDIRNLIDNTIENCQDIARDKKIKIDFKKPDDLPKITIDSEKIKLVIQNFIENAIKYSKENSKIIVTLESDENNIKLKVQDFGIGIPKNQQNKIFTEFFRGDNAIKNNPAGSGLGLFLSKNIIEAHKGKIWFTSEENIGTNFYFSLPI